MEVFFLRCYDCAIVYFEARKQGQGSAPVCEGCRSKLRISEDTLSVSEAPTVVEQDEDDSHDETFLQFYDAYSAFRAGHAKTTDELVEARKRNVELEALLARAEEHIRALNAHIASILADQNHRIAVDRANLDEVTEAYRAHKAAVLATHEKFDPKSTSSDCSEITE